MVQLIVIILVSIILVMAYQLLTKNKKTLLAFYKSLYNEEVQGWQDLRKEDRNDANQWCHGSTGIGLSRVLINNEQEELIVSIDKVLNGYHKVDDGLCHGNMGDIELLLTYAEKMHKE